MLGAIKLVNKLRNRQRGGERNSHADPVTLIQCLDMPRPPGRRRKMEQPRPPERDSKSGDPTRPRIRDWFVTDRESRHRKKHSLKSRRDDVHRRNEDRYDHDGRRNEARRFIKDEDYMHIDEEIHLGKGHRRREKYSHRNEGIQERPNDTDMYHRCDKERRRDKVQYKDEDFHLNEEEENYLPKRSVLNNRKHYYKENKLSDILEDNQRCIGKEKPRQIDVKPQKRRDEKPPNQIKSSVYKRLPKDDSKPIKSKKQLLTVKSKRRPSLTLKKSGIPHANKTKCSKRCDNKKTDLSSQKDMSSKQKGWVDNLRVYKEPHNRRLTVFKGILGTDKQCKFDKSKTVLKPTFGQTGLRRDIRKPSDWQAHSTRFEVNARLGNIEKSLKDLTLSTKNVVYTRLRVIENSLKDMTGFRDKWGNSRTKLARTKRLSRSRNRVAPKQKEKQTTQWVHESKAYQKDAMRTTKEKTKSLAREKKVTKKEKKKHDREIKPKVVKEKSPEREKKRFKKERKLEETKREPDLKPETPVEVPEEEVKPETAYPEKITCDVHIPSGQGDRRNLKDMHFCIFDDTIIDVDGAPKQRSIVDTTIEGDLCPPDLRGIVVLDIDNTIAIVVTDWANRSIKCFYSIGTQNCYSQLKLAAGPWGIKKLRNNLIGVTIPKAQQIMLLQVNPDLTHESTIETSKSYWGLAVMTSSTLIAGSSQPSCLDEIDVEGNVLQSFSNISSPDGTIENPDCIHVTKTGNILLSDSGRKSVMCVTSSGDVIFTFSPRKGQELLYPSGVVSISSGDILLADSAANKVIHLSEAGSYERDLLASRSDVEKPFGLCVSGKDIYVATRCREVQVYSFS